MVNASRAVMSLIGVVTFVFGIIIAIQPASFASSVGFDRANGVFLILVGIVLGIASNVLPLISRGSSISTFSKTNDSTTQQTGLVGAEPIISK